MIATEKSRDVVLLCSEFPPYPGGIGNHGYNLATELSRHGFNVTVVTPVYFDNTRANEFDHAQQFTILRIKGRRLIKLMHTLRILRIIKGQPILIASGMLMLLVGAISRLIKQGKKVAIAHGLDINSSNLFLRYAIHHSLSCYDCIIPVSQYTASKIPTRLKSRIYIINNGFNASLFRNTHKRNREGNRVRLVTVGSVSQRKGQINVVRALPFLLKHFDCVTYDVVGTPTPFQRLIEREMQYLGVTDCVRFHGILGHKEMCDVLGEADIFVMLSTATLDGDFEGFGIAILEANALGLPAIGSIGSGIEDAIRHCVSGQMIEATNPMSFVDAVRAVMDDYDTYASNAIEHSRFFDWKVVGEKYVKCLTEVAAS